MMFRLFGITGICLMMNKIKGVRLHSFFMFHIETLILVDIKNFVFWVLTFTNKTCIIVLVQ